MAKKGEIIVGLDIGTTKICAIVGEKTDIGVDIVGIGTSVSTGLRKGVVINIDSTVESIKKAVEEAELMAGVEISSVYCGIAGGHIKGFNSHGIVAVKEKEVKETDIRRVIDAAKAVAIPLDREVIHIIPQEYIIDDQDGIKEPLGMSGVRLEAKVHIVTGAVSSAQNIIKCANRTGLNVSDIVLQQIASSEAVLEADEKELGVALIDIGGGTTDIAIFSGGSIVHTAVLSLGGNHITNDLAVGLRTPTPDAEKLKIQYGCAMTSLVQKDELIEVQTVGGRKSRTFSKKEIAQIIEPRVEEILSLVQREIVKSGYEDLLASGVVITGGSTLLNGMQELAEMTFDLPVKKGVPKGFGGLLDIVSSPIYATGVGLVLYGSKDTSNTKFKIREHNIYHKVKSRMVEWIAEIF
ncbi:MAG: cell division protein FtsA [Deltaproteobacteria bacterium GWA2_38_16]|nr:MAG: cell division protein FtsA [Deltaproteobacteria bacterium GWA2_38_16]OGQ02411.1 MAG: cell division protein FtsA [Deltaproteobacteria bacterium RIFCSPHIGHO2_02_FULL_38_15]OGQ29953.1 MAG: cell division protein FtsA [Deltaproteobacteria bacterium RIFCSPLOWO2_01_FULL_38_9]HBQ20749.1 cell division protein FtsA [Deltaproteobacteria bacterium]